MMGYNVVNYRVTCVKYNIEYVFYTQYYTGLKIATLQRHMKYKVHKHLVGH